MRGPRPSYSPSPKQIEAIVLANKNRDYDDKFRDGLSRLHGTTVYVYTASGEFVEEFSSIIRAKKAYGIKLHHNTFKKKVEKAQLIDGHTFSFIPLH